MPSLLGRPNGERNRFTHPSRRARIEKEIRTDLEANEAEEISTRELRENIEGKNDTIASVLNELARQGRLKRRKKGKQKGLWSLIRGEVPGPNAEAEESLKKGVELIGPSGKRSVEHTFKGTVRLTHRMAQCAG